MASTVGDYVVRRLHEWGGRRVYGYSGDGINGLLGAFERSQEQVRFIQTRHEEMAAFIACGHAKWTGEVGVCCATSGPGAIHLLNGLYDAKLDHQPVVAIVGQTFVRAMGGQSQQEVDDRASHLTIVPFGSDGGPHARQWAPYVSVDGASPSLTRRVPPGRLNWRG